MKSFHQQVAEFESKIIKQAIESCGGNRDLAAIALSISPATLYRKLITSDRTEPHGNQGKTSIRMLYLISHPDTGLTKIGFTASPRLRLRQLQAKASGAALIRTMPGSRHDEATLHFNFMPKRVRGEWFKLDQEDIAEIDVWAHKREHSIPDEVMPCKIVKAPLYFTINSHS